MRVWQLALFHSSRKVIKKQCLALLRGDDMFVLIGGFVVRHNEKGKSKFVAQILLEMSNFIENGLSVSQNVWLSGTSGLHPALLCMFSLVLRVLEKTKRRCRASHVSNEPTISNTFLKSVLSVPRPRWLILSGHLQPEASKGNAPYAWVRLRGWSYIKARLPGRRLNFRA